ncbi:MULTISPECIES: dihydrofolate reductase [Halanaerobium]|uniref:Dihydrofolate reductase n=1 Tax=Halanaerobium kushneri TaxID=56779 RepID=A0A1N6PJ99_9FIRM|nr:MULTISPECIES: dihydrofolate reductase [Halanaerobium]PUU87901.1 MAG: dihydrofolate reductase [Halanaerobium sp.]SDL02574.1 dihydrofolate reductase [Halanaerobium congolense]SDN10612.1 dihydrofolate reductase [Halanaerobium congolense]SIQ04376.1 dihydrofolate reductase [Halanaerobium kushneri]
MSLSIIAAMDQNQLIGEQGKIPWKLPADLKYFKEITMGAPVIMGRKTFKSIGFPLPGRKNIILTRNKDYTAEGCEVVHSKKEILNEFLKKKEEAFIIGGAEIYKQFLKYSDKLYLTIIEHQFSGDTYFPEVDWQKWYKVSEKKGTTESDNPYSYSYHIFQRKNQKSRSDF